MSDLDKKRLRQQVLKQRAKLDSQARLGFDQNLYEQCCQIIKAQNPKRVHIYLSLEGEVNTQKIIEYCWQNEITVVVPETLKRGQLRHRLLEVGAEMEYGSLNCRWPKNGAEYLGPYDLIICPGLAFTALGARLGYGGGYYDRFLQNQKEALKIALAYPFQVLADLPKEKHDIMLDRILVAKQN